MDYRKIGNEFYIRIDKDDEILSKILEVCKKENVRTAHFRGIGGCDKINIQTFIPAKNDFISHEKEGVFEMISLDGNISPDNDEIFLHAHAVFSYLENDEIKMIGGHLKEAFVKYTAEIILTPAVENISRMIDDKTGISVWKLH
jgi:hypothetical protein